MLRCPYLYYGARTDTADRTNSSEKHGTPYNTWACRFWVLHVEYLMKHEMMGWLFFPVCDCTVEYIKRTSRYTCLYCLLILHPAVCERNCWNIFGDPSRALIVGCTLVITHKLRQAFLLWRRWVTYISCVTERRFSVLSHEAVPGCEVYSPRNVGEIVVRLYRTLLKYLPKQLFVMRIY